LGELAVSSATLRRCVSYAIQELLEDGRFKVKGLVVVDLVRLAQRIARKFEWGFIVVLFCTGDQWQGEQKVKGGP